ncbi:MAG: hypothetical protein MR301_03325 [Prevotella sp.]|nr:hypothetical protein [Prevotella sp.]MDD7046778.1 hypothetical protein [Prevotella sp.]MDY5546657.1 hypothetical protein [Prevotella sp.]
MGTFRSIDELVRTLDREKTLLKEMFAKRHSLQFRYDYAMELTEYKETRIRFLIENGVIRDTGDCLEMEDVYQKFFEDVLEVNEEINVSSVRDYISALNENIDYYLKENNETRKYKYLKEVRRCLKTIALATVRNVLDLKRNMDNTYKNEPNYAIKKAKLQRLCEKLKNISQLITESERVIDSGQPVFFAVAMDVQMRSVVNDVRLQLNESYHNLLEIERQIIQYLNLIDYQNRIFEKVKKLKYLKDQFRWEEATDVRQVMIGRNPVWMEPQAKYYIKLSIENLRTSDDALQCIRLLSEKLKRRNGRRPGNAAEAIPDDYLKGNKQKLEAVNLQEVYNSFAASGTNLFAFVMNYQYDKKQSREDKMVYFCQIASQYVDKLKFTGNYAESDGVEYPVILPR